MPTREELIQRQEQDTGHPSDTVYYIPKKWRDDTGKGWGKVYHANPNCHLLGNTSRSPREATREEAQNRWLGPCSHCILRKTQRNMGGTGKEYDDDLLNDLTDDR